MKHCKGFLNGEVVSVNEVIFMKKKASIIVSIVAILILAWIFVSFMQVVNRNLDEATYSWWNAFQIFLNLAKN